MVPRLFFSCVLYGSRDAVENFNRDVLQHSGNYVGIKSVLIANVSMYGSERFEQFHFDNASRLVYLVLALAPDCRYGLFLQLPGIISFLDFGP